MQKGQEEYAIRKALEVFDEWNDVTGCFPRFTGYYYEACVVIEDAVKIGIYVALDIPFVIKDGKPVSNPERGARMSVSSRKQND